MIGQADWNLTQPDVNSKMRLWLMSRSNYVKLEDIDGGVLYRRGRYYFAIDNELNSLCYIIKTDLITIGVTLNETIIQRVLWVDNTSAVATKLVSYVFWKYLLSQHHVISSDNEQTEHGRRFWFNRVVEAFKKDLFVYVTYTTNPRSITRITNRPEFDKIVRDGKVWGDDHKSKYKKIVISDKPLLAKPGVIDNT